LYLADPGIEKNVIRPDKILSRPIFGTAAEYKIIQVPEIRARERRLPARGTLFELGEYLLLIGHDGVQDSLVL
jgi:hypothetical protein